MQNLVFGLAAVIFAILKTIFVDTFKNIKFYIIIFTDKEERLKIKHKLDLEKRQEIIEERLGAVERLVYAIYNDPSYTKKEEGQYDLKELKKRVNK